MLAGLLLVHSHVDLALHLFNVNCRHLASAGETQANAAVEGWAAMPCASTWQLPAVNEDASRRLPAGRSPVCKLTNLAPTPRLLAADTHERLAALCPTPDGRLLLAAGTSGLVTLRWLHSLQVGGGLFSLVWA